MKRWVLLAIFVLILALLQFYAPKSGNDPDPERFLAKMRAFDKFKPHLSDAN